MQALGFGATMVVAEAVIQVVLQETEGFTFDYLNVVVVVGQFRYNHLVDMVAREKVRVFQRSRRRLLRRRFFNKRRVRTNSRSRSRFTVKP